MKDYRDYSADFLYCVRSTFLQPSVLLYMQRKYRLSSEEVMHLQKKKGINFPYFSASSILRKEQLQKLSLDL